MRLYSCQPLFVYDLLMSGKTWTASPFELPAPEGALAQVEAEMRQAYDWLARQMRSRSILPQNPATQYPIWGWSQWNGADQIAPDMDCESIRSCATGHPHVMLTLEIDPERALLSDFEAWHWVINQWFMGDHADEFEARCKALDPDFEFGSIPKDPGLARQMERSWEAIFDPALCAQILQVDPASASIQAVFWELRPQDVVAAVAFDPVGPLRELPTPSRASSSSLPPPPRTAPPG